MAHPINNIDYLLRNWDSLQRYPFFAFFLFTERDQSFAELFQRQFKNLDRWSGEACMFFAIAPPRRNG